MGVAADAPPRRTALAVVVGVSASAAWVGVAALTAGLLTLGAGVDEQLPGRVLVALSLAAVVAVPLTALTWAAWTSAARTDRLSVVTGSLLIGWIVVEAVVAGAYSWFQPLSVAVGATLIAVGGRARLGPVSRGAIATVLGAVLVGIGIGLSPHVFDGGTLASIVAAVGLVAGGCALVVIGARWVLRGRRWPVQLGGGLATGLLLAVLVWLLAPPVAATNVPPSEIGATPADRDLDADDVVVTTSDGVDLAGWYLDGSNGAAVVLRHGAGSTRSDVLDQAAVLHRHGYGVLLLDARGHGDSEGRAMDFGWYGDADIAAGTAFLATRSGVDPDRIGVVGMSMGGEEAIGAAAGDPHIRAVVAEGATGRTSADKAWLSDAYGWRGALQEQFERVQFWLTDYLTDSSPPLALHDAVAAAEDVRFLLITAGTVADESSAGSYIASAAPDRVETWNVPGASHTGGLRTDPVGWEATVIGFLQEQLGAS